MQRKTKLLLDIIKIIINIFSLIFMILSFITENKVMYDCYWSIIPLMLGFEAGYLLEWSKKDEMNIDKKKSQTIRSSFDGLTTATTVIAGLIFLTVLFFEVFNHSIRTNPIIMIIIYLLLTIAVVGNHLAIYSANKDTRKLVEETFYNKK